MRPTKCVRIGSCPRVCGLYLYTREMGVRVAHHMADIFSERYWKGRSPQFSGGRGFEYSNVPNRYPSIAWKDDLVLKR
jgi:hypothetical protein